jgi:hypothetical protein
MKIKNIFLSICCIIFVFGCVLPMDVLAKKTIGDATSNFQITAGQTGIAQTDVTTIVGGIIKTILGLSGLIFFMLVFYGGFLWMTARGNNEQIEKAKNTLITSVIGLVIMVMSYAITVFITERLA